MNFGRNFAYFIIVFIKLTAFFTCHYFVKEIPNGFPCLDTVIQTLGMLLNFQKAKKTCLMAHVFYSFVSI